MLIGSKEISDSNKPFVVAELSSNHNGSLERALKCVDIASEAGVDAIKLQTYTADSITLNIEKDEFFIKEKDSLWKGQSLFSLYQKGQTPWEWHKPIFDKAKSKGLICFSSPFDFQAVDFLETLDVPCYKIASPECIDIPLIKKAAGTGKPLIISTGMATEEEISVAVKTAKDSGCKSLALLKCTSAYPAKLESCNLKTILEMKSKFGCEIGFSDHTLGINASIAAVGMGATIIEKHFTISKDDEGIDSKFSLDAKELKKLVQSINEVWKSKGKVIYGPTEEEKTTLLYRRSLYIVEDIKAGEKLTEKNLRSIRPAYGLNPKFYFQVLGKTVSKDLKKGTPLKLDFIVT